MSELQFDFETLADAANIDMGDSYDPAHTQMGGAQLHFKTAPCVVKALEERVASGLYGWTSSNLPQYTGAVRRWMADVRDWTIEEDWIVPSYGTLQAMCAAMRAFTQPGDGVILQPPAYVLYDSILTHTGRTKVCNPLIYENGCYRMDFDGLEALMAEPRNKMMILCNPHNPIMDFWEAEDLARVAALAKANGVLVVADEIFAEHLFDGERLTPYATVPGAAEHCIITTSIGKSFNFTGESHANVIIPNPALRAAYTVQRNADHYGSLSPFMYTALLAAYTPEGKAWIDALLDYVGGNLALLQMFFAKRFPGVVICRHRAGTLLWLDLRPLGLDEAGIETLFRRANISVDLGSKYGDEGRGFVRIQIGMPRTELTRTLDRLLAAGQAMGLAQ